ncbi:tripartite motif-containing protein 2-like [Anneissia japonica]|uniref:tripartite motif-containing protein 2-like n=1 Tax=Anneissia japonica TaxID=1529436 RepID=UPI001425BAEF|nr:tripartite motif-containing protein 2-like [Anneissia japonica]
MSASKPLQFFDKNNLQCAICFEKIKEPRTLTCQHSYCLKCLDQLIQTDGHLKCPQCRQEDQDIGRVDLISLGCNKMISYLLENMEKVESEKPTTCSSCDNLPEFHCSECFLYLCEHCTERHKITPDLKDHQFYTLEKDGRPNSVQEFYCSTCKKSYSTCKKCEHYLCLQNKHDVIEMKIAVEKFNQEATEVIKIAQGIKSKLQGTLAFIPNDISDFEHHLKLCRTAIEVREQTLIRKVQEKSKEFISDLERIYKEKKEDIDSKVQDINETLTQVNSVMNSIDDIMNKPQETETLESHKVTINPISDKVIVLGADFDQLFNQRNITPHFTPSENLDDLMNTDGFGKIISVDGMYRVAKDDEEITVTKGQLFVVKISSLAEKDAGQLSATLRSSLGEESATEVVYQGNGEYRIKSRCNVEGDWKMKITAGAAHIKGSPVNIKVEKLGLIYEIGNISEYKEHNKAGKVTDVVLDTDGCLLVSSYSEDVLKFDQSGSFVARIQAMPQDAEVIKMHQLGGGRMVYSDYLKKCVVLCDDKYQEICSFGKGTLKYPDGLTVNKQSRVLYVADREAHCVFKFNVPDGKLLGKIGSKGSEVGQMNKPYDVTLTKEGYVIVADFENNRIQMFGTNDKLMKVLVGCSKEDGKVWHPCGVTMDMDENILISSNHKLQLFDKNGVFIKRIDHENEELATPAGISVISSRPRRVAVANYSENNVKIFNY